MLLFLLTVASQALAGPRWPSLLSRFLSHALLFCFGAFVREVHCAEIYSSHTNSNSRHYPPQLLAPKQQTAQNNAKAQVVHTEVKRTQQLSKQANMGQGRGARGQAGRAIQKNELASRAGNANGRCAWLCWLCWGFVRRWFCCHVPVVAGGQTPS